MVLLLVVFHFEEGAVGRFGQPVRRVGQFLLDCVHSRQSFGEVAERLEVVGGVAAQASLFVSQNGQVAWFYRVGGC